MNIGMLAQLSEGGQAVVFLAVVLLVLGLAAILAAAKMVRVGNPSEMLIISGRRQRDGQGYRTLIGGKTLVIPIIEKVARLSLRNNRAGVAEVVSRYEFEKL